MHMITDLSLPEAATIPYALQAEAICAQHCVESINRLQSDLEQTRSHDCCNGSLLAPPTSYALVPGKITFTLDYLRCL